MYIASVRQYAVHSGNEGRVALCIAVSTAAGAYIVDQYGILP